MQPCAPIYSPIVSISSSIDDSRAYPFIKLEVACQPFLIPYKLAIQVRFEFFGC